MHRAGQHGSSGRGRAGQGQQEAGGAGAGSGAAQGGEGPVPPRKDEAPRSLNSACWRLPSPGFGV